MESTSSNAERLASACVLSIAGGFLDIYTCLCRGRVFANAVTGNMALFGYHLFFLHWTECAKYLLAILCYAVGIFIADLVQPAHARVAAALVAPDGDSAGVPLPRAGLFHAGGKFDFQVNGVISFVCAMLVQTFRRVRGLPFASTMCTGNLRNGTDALYRSVFEQERGELRKALHYYGVILCFILVAAAGAFLLREFGRYIFLVVPAGIATVFFLILSRREQGGLAAEVPAVPGRRRAEITERPCGGMCRRGRLSLKYKESKSWKQSPGQCDCISPSSGVPMSANPAS